MQLPTSTRQEEVRECCENWLEEAPADRDEVQLCSDSTPASKVDGGFQSLYDFLGLDEASPTPEPPKDRYLHVTCGSLTQPITDSIRSSHRGSAEACEHPPQNCDSNPRSTLDSD